MTADKRAVHTDALETLGTIIGENEKRDAIHLAVEPVIAAEDLLPGQDVGRVNGGFGRCVTPLGIVDPFIKGVVRKGQRFWLVVYPRQISSLRHVWTHPAFDAVEDLPAIEKKKTTALPAPSGPVQKAARTKARPKVPSVATPQAQVAPQVVDPEPEPVNQLVENSKAYISNLAEQVGISYNRLMDGAQEWVADQAEGHYGSYIVGGAEMEGESVPDAFWTHFEIVTGTVVPDECRGSFFSCSC